MMILYKRRESLKKQDTRSRTCTTTKMTLLIIHWKSNDSLVNSIGLSRLVTSIDSFLYKINKMNYFLLNKIFLIFIKILIR
jgi:hypothetical protein